MPPRRKKFTGLTEEDVARLRSQLGEGRRPRVALSGPQFEAGASGAVVRIGDPAVDGADFLTVRVKVNGVTDELAFAPAELNIGRAGARPATPAGSVGTRSAGAGSATAGAPVARSGASGTATATPDVAGSATPAGNPATPAGRRRKAPAAPTVSVTISSTGASWSVSASRGARTITKNVAVAPGVVTAIADLLHQAGLSEAVAEINETARLQAQQRAEELRAELSDLEAVLATHRAPR
ncbi:MAG: hypothetical protein QOI26_2244 [Pseudonocardiales bacterium]|jgi:hypothetical protein|nr:hypothetical protein [Pseudonocardiales bacterium]